MKKLYRSKENKVLFGIIGGFAEYIDQDAVLLRVVFVFLLIFTGFFPFGLFYIACLFVIPENQITQDNRTKATNVDASEVKVESGSEGI